MEKLQKKIVPLDSILYESDLRKDKQHYRAKERKIKLHQILSHSNNIIFKDI